MTLQLNDYCRHLDALFLITKIDGDLITCSDGFVRDVKMITRISRDPHKFLRWLRSLGVWDARFQTLYDSALFQAPELRGSLWISLSNVLNGFGVREELCDKIKEVFDDRRQIPEVPESGT